MKKILALLLALCMVFALCACGSSTSGTSSSSAPSDSSAAAGDTIKIGVFEPATGENGAGGQQEVIGIRYANSVKPTVTVDGKEYNIELVEVDNQSDKSAAVTAAQSLISQGVSVVLGSYGSGVSIAAGSTFKEAQIPAIGCSCTNPQVTSGNDYYFRVCFLDPFQGSVMASYAKTAGCSTAAVINQNGDDYSTGLANYFKDAFSAMDGCSVVYTGTYNTNETDFTAILTKAKEANPDVIFVPSSIVTAGLIIKQARDMGITCRIMAGDTWENQTIIDNAGAENCEGVALSTFFSPDDPTAADFVNGFKEYINSNADAKKLNGGNDTVAAVSALGYDAYMAACAAIEGVSGEITGTAIRDSLTQVNFEGVTGTIAFDENGDSLKDTAFIKEIRDGQFKFIGTQKTDGTFTAA
jgi:branched-chain amino acid transport system substrate-binding protein